jgi:EAL domain-containing protein (putative c-di-GMP-specific phosphodiesterase class I)
MFEGIAGDLIRAAQTNGVQLELSMVRLAGLDAQFRGATAEGRKPLEARVSGALRAEAYGDAAADLGDERFAVLRQATDTPDAIARRLSRVLGAAVNPTAHSITIDGDDTPAKMMRALRYSLDTFVTDGAGALAGSLSEVIGHSVERAVAKAGAFGALVEDRRFKLAFQPVVALATGAVHHHEVLVRFDGDRSPFAMIRMAEELDIIERLDIAVADETAKRLRADKTQTLCLAVNVSGRTIVSPDFITAISHMAKAGDLRDRLMFEVTESSAIDDLRAAQRNIGALQALGLKVCLDDFGSGASSFAYLQQLSIDVVKIDGSYVRELASSGRDGAMIRHLVGLCHELGVEVVGEMVETQAIEDILRRSGVDYAQGWLYGQPTPEPVSPPPRPVASAARRNGAAEQWG